jgi:hypothetical protein
MREMTLRWTTALAAGLTVLTLLTSCGGGSDRTKARLRLVNASSGYAQLELRVDDQLKQSPVRYGETADFVDVDPGKASSTLTSVGSPTALLSFTPSVSAKNYFTVLAYGSAGSLKQLLLDENSGEPANNNALLRVVNAAPDAGALDVYVTGSSDTLQAAVPVQANAAVDAIGGTLSIANGTWRLRVTAAGSKTDLRLDLPAVALANRQVATLVLTPGSGGVLIQALLLTQQGSVAALSATQARVRVATGLSNVNVQLAGTTLLSGLGTAAVTAYSVQPSGNTSLSVSVGGVGVAVPAMSLSAGADYTLLVHGAATAPLVQWIVDDNTLPSDRTQAKARLLNGVAGLSGALSMTIDSSPVAVGVAAGSASAYALEVPGTTARVVVAADGGVTVFSAIDQTFAAASNYTVFVLGDAAAPAGVLRKDR